MKQHNLNKPCLLACLSLLFSPCLWAQNNPGGNGPGNGPAEPPPNLISPARRIERGPRPDNPPNSDDRFRSIDGSGNNLSLPSMGAAHTALVRLVDSDYADGIAAMAGEERVSARVISNAINAQTESLPNQRGATDFVWQWGQFIDHDIDLTDGVDPAEPANIAVPPGDPWFDPTGSGSQSMAFNRSIYDPETGDSVNNPREQLNEISTWMDASNVYGSDAVRAAALRTMDGSGRLKVSNGRLLPFNTEGLANAGGSGDHLFLAGDVRANEQLGLTAMHTLFVREHNWQAAQIRQANPQLTGEQIYQQAREMVAAEIQAITYFEYLPILLGENALPPYQGYNDRIHAGIANLFSGAVFRYGHSALSPQLLRLNRRGQAIEAGHLPLREAFFAPDKLSTDGGIEPILRGLATQVCQQVDNYLIDDVRNFLFGAPGSGGFDLASLNIQRGRDHGLPGYNAVRAAYGLARKNSFADVTSDAGKQAALASVYASVDDIDLWVGGLSEDTLPGALVGELIQVVLAEQFAALRDGDRFYFAGHLDRRRADEVRRTRLSDIIRRNTNIGNELQDNVFVTANNP
jgi:peroxidase